MTDCSEVCPKHAEKSAAENIKSYERRCILNDKKCFFKSFQFLIMLGPAMNNFGNMNFQKPVIAIANFKARPDFSPFFK